MLLSAAHACPIMIPIKSHWFAAINKIIPTHSASSYIIGRMRQYVLISSSHITQQQRKQKSRVVTGECRYEWHLPAIYRNRILVMIFSFNLIEYFCLKRAYITRCVSAEFFLIFFPLFWRFVCFDRRGNLASTSHFGCFFPYRTHKTSNIMAMDPSGRSFA